MRHAFGVSAGAAANASNDRKPKPATTSLTRSVVATNSGKETARQTARGTTRRWTDGKPGCGKINTELPQQGAREAERGSGRQPGGCRYLAAARQKLPRAPMTEQGKEQRHRRRPNLTRDREVRRRKDGRRWTLGFMSKDRTRRGETSWTAVGSCSAAPWRCSARGRTAGLPSSRAGRGAEGCTRERRPRQCANKA